MMQVQGFIAGSDRSFLLADRDYPFRSEPPSPILSVLEDASVIPTGPSRSFIPLLSTSQTAEVRDRDLLGPSVTCEPGAGHRGKNELSRCSSDSFLLQEASPFTSLALSDANDASWLDLRHNHSHGRCRDGDVGFGLFGAQQQGPDVLELLATEASASSAPLSPWDWSGGSGDVGATIEGHVSGSTWRKFSEDVPGGKEATALTEKELQTKEGNAFGRMSAQSGRPGVAYVQQDLTEGAIKFKAADSVIRYIGTHDSDSEVQPRTELVSNAREESYKIGTSASLSGENTGSPTATSTQASSVISSPHGWNPVIQVQCPAFTQAGATYTQQTSPWAPAQVPRTTQENMRENSHPYREYEVSRRTECRVEYAWHTNGSGGAAAMASLQRPEAGYNQAARETNGNPGDHVNGVGVTGDTPSLKSVQVTRCMVGYMRRSTAAEYGRDRTLRSTSHDEECYEAGLGFGPSKSALVESCISPSSLTRSTTASSTTALPPDKADPSWVGASPPWSETDSDYVRGSTGAGCDGPSGGTFQGIYATGLNERVTQPMAETVSPSTGRQATTTSRPRGQYGVTHTRHVYREGVALWSRNEGLLGKTGGRWEARESADHTARYVAHKQISLERSVTGEEHHREGSGCRQYPERTLSLPSTLQCPSFVGYRTTGATGEVVDPSAGVRVLGESRPIPMDVGRFSRRVHCAVSLSRCSETGTFASNSAYTGLVGDTNSQIVVSDPIGGQARHIAYNGKGAVHRHYEGTTDERGIAGHTPGNPAWFSCSSGPLGGHNAEREYQHVPGVLQSAGRLVGNCGFTVESSQQYGAPKDDPNDQELGRLHESQEPGGSCSRCNVAIPAGNKRSIYDTEGICFSDNVLKKVRTNGDVTEKEVKGSTIFVQRTETACPEVERGGWQTLAPELGSSSREELERYPDDGGTQGDDDSNLQWHEGFTLPLGKDGRGELIKRMRSVHKADREFCRFSLEGMGIDFKRLAHATVEELWKIAYRWGLFGYAVKLSKKYGKTATSPSRKKVVQALSAVPNPQPLSPDCSSGR